jgi:hypothetical protein
MKGVRKFPKYDSTRGNVAKSSFERPQGPQ